MSGSRISKLIFFVDSTSNSEKKSYITFSLKRLLFSLDHFELYDYFLAKKKVKFTKWPPKMSRHQILYSNETLFYVKLSKFSIFNSFVDIGIHLLTVSKRVFLIIFKFCTQLLQILKIQFKEYNRCDL
jgi:hypothetical protein